MAEEKKWDAGLSKDQRRDQRQINRNFVRGCMNGNRPLVHNLFPKVHSRIGSHGLVCAAMHGRRDVVRLLVNLGVDQHYRNNLARRMAQTKGFDAIVKYLDKNDDTHHHSFFTELKTTELLHNPGSLLSVPLEEILEEPSSKSYKQ